MGLVKLTVIAFVLAALTCRGEPLISTSYPDKSTVRLVDDLVNIVTSCFKHQTNGVGLAGNLPSTLLRRLSVQQSIPVALIDNILDFDAEPLLPDLQFRQKLKVFIIEASSFRKLDTLIQQNIKYSIWWNHMASFFILDLSDGCVNAEGFLYLAWQVDLLHAKVMCRNHKSGRIIINYNPFSSQAPACWQRVKFLEGINKHPFTLLSRKYRENETLCDVDFEKTTDLGGYPIRVHGVPLDGWTTREKAIRGQYTYWSERERILSTVFRTLNATLKFDGLTNRLTDMGTARKGGTDIQKNTMVLKHSWTIKYGDTIAYPHKQVGNSIVTNFRGLKSQLNKILSVIDAESRYGMIVVYLVTLMFLKFFVRQGLVPAMLNLVRITTNVGFTNLNSDTGSRIYLGCLLFFVVTMQGIYQGDLAALLTKNIPLRNADTIEDLKYLDYKKLYIRYFQKEIFLDSDVKDLVTVVDDSLDCIMPVTNDSSAACLELNEATLFDLVQKFNLHVGKESIEPVYVGFGIRWNWPVEERVNTIIARMVEASVLENWDVKTDPLKFSDFYVEEAVKNNKDFKKIGLDEMLFAFVILGIGLACATVVFVIELATKYKCICNCRIVRR